MRKAVNFSVWLFAASACVLLLALIVCLGVRSVKDDDGKRGAAEVEVQVVPSLPAIAAPQSQPQKQITSWEKTPCLACGGDGIYVYHKCSICLGQRGWLIACWECKGAGQVVVGAGGGIFASPYGDVGVVGGVVKDTCKTCKGSGLAFSACSACSGAGQVPERCASCEGRGWFFTLK